MLQANQTQPPLDATVKAAVMISGGSYQCYNVPPIAHIGCDNCKCPHSQPCAVRERVRGRRAQHAGGAVWGRARGWSFWRWRADSNV